MCAGLAAGNLAGLEATRADVGLATVTVNDDGDALDVRLERAVHHTVGVADGMTRQRRACRRTHRPWTCSYLLGGAALSRARIFHSRTNIAHAVAAATRNPNLLWLFCVASSREGRHGAGAADDLGVRAGDHVGNPEVVEQAHRLVVELPSACRARRCACRGATATAEKVRPTASGPSLHARSPASETTLIS